MRDGALKRGHSPGYRSRSNSQSRSRSPWSRSRSRSPRSRSRSRTRSPWDRSSRSPPGRYSTRSPARGYSRSPSRSPRPQRGGAPAARSQSSDESGQIKDRSRGRRDRGSDRRRAQPAPPQQQPQQQTSMRPGIAPEQLQAMQQQLDAEQVARAAAESTAELLKNKVREVAERSKARGNSLAALLSAVRRVADAKQQLSSAEAELQQALQDAEAFLRDEGTTAQAQNVVSRPPALEQNHQPQPQPPQHANEHAADTHIQDIPPASEEAGGGWVQASTALPRQAPLSNIKFSLKL